MIRINLIAERRKATVARRERRVGGFDDLASWLLLGLVVVGLGVTALQYFRLQGAVEQKREEIAAARQEAEELAPIIKEVERYKESKAELENKIRIINELKANQRGPVRIMDAVSAALPELLWLTRLDVRESLVTISGQAGNTNAVANYIDALDRVPEFQEPILKDITQRADAYTFTITFRYQTEAASTDAAGGDGEPGGGAEEV